MPAPANGARRAANKQPSPRRAATVAAILATLPATKVRIVEITGYDRSTVYGVIKQLREAKTIRVSKWAPHPVHGPSIATFAIGSTPDAKDTVKRLTKKERSDRHMAKIKGTDKHDQRKAKWRARHWVKKAASVPRTWLSALGVV